LSLFACPGIVVIGGVDGSPACYGAVVIRWFVAFTRAVCHVLHFNGVGVRRSSLLFTECKQHEPDCQKEEEQN